MSEQSKKVKRPQETRLTHAQFFRVCEELRNHREQLSEMRPSQSKAAECLSEWCKFPVGVGSVATAMEATGVTWSVKKNTVGQQALVRKARMRTLAKSIVILFRNLGMTPENDLLDMIQEMYGEGHEPTVVRDALDDREKKRQEMASNR